MPRHRILTFFFFNDTATTEIYTLSLHDALPISNLERVRGYLEAFHHLCEISAWQSASQILFTSTKTSNDKELQDRKSTRLNSSHANISYAVFCLKKKINKIHAIRVYVLSCNNTL